MYRGIEVSFIYALQATSDDLDELLPDVRLSWNMLVAIAVLWVTTASYYLQVDKS